RQQELSQCSGNEPEAFRSQGPEHEAQAGADDGPQGYAGPGMHCWLPRTQRSHGGPFTGGEQQRKQEEDATQQDRHKARAHLGQGAGVEALASNKNGEGQQRQKCRWQQRLKISRHGPISGAYCPSLLCCYVFLFFFTRVPARAAYCSYTQRSRASPSSTPGPRSASSWLSMSETVHRRPLRERT